MLTWIKLGNRVFRNIEAKYIDENGNEIWNVPNTVPELQKAFSDTLVWLEKRRLNEILDQYGYNSLADVQFYANQNDAEAVAILNFYSNTNANGYDDLIWNWINNTLPTYTTLEQLLSLDMQAVEEQIYQQAITNNPLP